MPRKRKSKSRGRTGGGRAAKPAKQTPRAIDLRSVEDAGRLAQLPNGLVLVRRMKHEWREELDRLDARKFSRETDSVRGSKFSREWTLKRYVEWVEAQILRLGWTRDTPGTDVVVVLPSPVGWSRGRSVSKIRIELSSRFVHAYPG
jgi:hypothetical protein